MNQCVVCQRSGYIYMSVFSAAGKTNSLEERIKTFCGVTVVEDKKRNQPVCKSCFRKLSKISELRVSLHALAGNASVIPEQPSRQRYGATPSNLGARQGGIDVSASRSTSRTPTRSIASGLAIGTAQAVVGASATTTVTGTLADFHPACRSKLRRRRTALTPISGVHD